MQIIKSQFKDFKNNKQPQRVFANVTLNKQNIPQKNGHLTKQKPKLSENNF